MKINEVCTLTGLTKKAIEYYQNKKIIDPIISKNGYREFNTEDVKTLKQVSLLRDLGLSVKEIKNVLQSPSPKEELRKYYIKMQLENDKKTKQVLLLEQLSNGADPDTIQQEIQEWNNRKTIKEKLLDSFPGFFGRFYYLHFGIFLDEPITTEEQQAAYETIIEFFDNMESPKLSDELLSRMEESMDVWTNEQIHELELNKIESLKNPNQFYQDYKDSIDEYIAFRNSDEFQQSAYSKLMKEMKSFGDTSGYNEIFIPAMRKLSKSYDDYYQSLLEANKKFLEEHPNFV